MRSGVLRMKLIDLPCPERLPVSNSPSREGQVVIVSGAARLLLWLAVGPV